MRFAIACTILLAGTGLGLCGCASPAQQARDKEDMLAAAGFVQHPANTPERGNSMRRLPPNQIVRIVHDQKVVYMYADPIVCDCLYIGDQHAWSNYQQERLQMRIANEQIAAAQLNQETAMQWDWGPWGPGWWQ
jgi:hypothetical protein